MKRNGAMTSRAEMGGEMLPPKGWQLVYLVACLLVIVASLIKIAYDGSPQ